VVDGCHEIVTHLFFEVGTFFKRILFIKSFSRLICEIDLVGINAMV